MARWGRLSGIVAVGVWIGVAFDAAGQGTVTVRKTDQPPRSRRERRHAPPPADRNDNRVLV